MNRLSFITKHIPNTVTCCNLLCGSFSMYFALHKGDIYTAALFIILAAVFDFFDGFLARLLKAYSNIGKDLDSLADVVSFGVAPAMLIFSCMEKCNLYEVVYILPVFVLGAFAALRLAKFNNDTRQTTSFIGLPVPANALFWIGVADIIVKHQRELSVYANMVLIAVYILVGIFSFLMVSELPMFSLKGNKDGDRKQLIMPLMLIVLAVVSVVRFGLAGFAITILLYLIMCVASLFKKK